MKRHACDIFDGLNDLGTLSSIGLPPPTTLAWINRETDLAPPSPLRLRNIHHHHHHQRPTPTSNRPKARRRILSAGVLVDEAHFPNYRGDLRQPLHIPDCSSGCQECRTSVKRARIGRNFFLTILPPPRPSLSEDNWFNVLSFLVPAANPHAFAWHFLGEEMALARIRITCKLFHSCLTKPGVIRVATLNAMKFLQQNRPQFDRVVAEVGAQTMFPSSTDIARGLERSLDLVSGSLVQQVSSGDTTAYIRRTAAMLCFLKNRDNTAQMQIRTLPSTPKCMQVLQAHIAFLGRHAFSREDIEGAFSRGMLPALQRSVMADTLTRSRYNSCRQNILREARSVLMTLPLQNERVAALRALRSVLPTSGVGEPFHIGWGDEAWGCLPQLPDPAECGSARSVDEWMALPEPSRCLRIYKRFTQWVAATLRPVAASWGRQATKMGMPTKELQTRFLKCLCHYSPRHFPCELPDADPDEHEPSASHDVSTPTAQEVYAVSAYAAAQHHPSLLACIDSYSLLESRELIAMAPVPCPRACNGPQTPCPRVTLPMGNIDLVAAAYTKLNVQFKSTLGTELIKLVSMPEMTAMQHFGLTF